MTGAGAVYHTAAVKEKQSVAIFGVGVNTDGVDIDGVRDFVVENSFIRAEDDGLGDAAQHRLT